MRDRSDRSQCAGAFEQLARRAVADPAALSAERAACREWLAPYPQGRSRGDSLVVCGGSASVFTDAPVPIPGLRTVVRRVRSSGLARRSCVGASPALGLLDRLQCALRLEARGERCRPNAGDRAAPDGTWDRARSHDRFDDDR